MINQIEPDSIIKSILDSPNETRTIEFKPSFPWPAYKSKLRENPKAQEVVCTIQAMSNSRDGGKILLGIGKNAGTGLNELQGMKRDDLETYGAEAIFEQVRNFARPEVCVVRSIRTPGSVISDTAGAP